MTPLSLLLTCVVLLPLVAVGQEEDPLLLEYSDYYYDLYYGEYDDYGIEDSHSTAPRSIRVDKPNINKNLKSKKTNNIQPQRASNSNPVPPVKIVPVSRREPLNVRLQRLLTADKSSARTILDILEAPAKSQLEILKFLKSIVSRIEQEVKSKQKSNNPLKTTNGGHLKKPLNLASQASRQLPRKTSKKSQNHQTFNQPFVSSTHSSSPNKSPNTLKGNLRPISKPNTASKEFKSSPNFQNHQSTNEAQRSTSGRSIQQKIPKKTQKQNKNIGSSSKSEPTKKSKSNNRFSNVDSEKSTALKQSSSSAVSIKEFLERYPEVKRLSSRFNDGDVSTKIADNSNINRGFGQEAGDKFTSFSQHSTLRNLDKTPQIIPKQRQTPTLPKDQQQANKNHANKVKQQKEREQKENAQREKEKGERELRAQKRQNQEQAKLEKEKRQKLQREKERREKERREKERKEKEKREKKKQINQQKEQTVKANQEDPPAYFDDYDSDYDYDYYYDQLVPEHERFFQLPKTSEATPTNSPNTNQQKNKKGFQVFTNFNPDVISNKKPKFQKTILSTQTPLKTNKNTKAAKSKPKDKNQSNALQLNSISGSAGKHGGSGGPQAGPFGYTEKGSFFIDDSFIGFPEKIEMVYQGFVWAFTMNYPDQSPVLHGGVHTILKDKVKKETLDLTGDYIVRVTGRASPYNINRFTLYTKEGKKYGPWGDRHSEESVDFDVSAPPGQALAFFSGTIDFGVPLRSVSFHWKPIS